MLVNKNGDWYRFSQEMILIISVPGTFFKNSERKGLRCLVPFFQYAAAQKL